MKTVMWTSCVIYNIKCCHTLFSSWSQASEPHCIRETVCATSHFSTDRSHLVLYSELLTEEHPQVICCLLFLLQFWGWLSYSYQAEPPHSVTPACHCRVQILMVWVQGLLSVNALQWWAQNPALPHGAEALGDIVQASEQKYSFRFS